MWRFTTQAQPSAWAQADFTAVSRPAPKVTSVAATSATSVTVTFDRTIDPASVLANGSQFTLSNGLTVSAATVSGKTVVLTTATQTGGTSYTVTVAGSVQDTQAKGVDAAANSGTFNGYEVQAVLRISEIAPNVASSRDIVEFQVVSGGSTRGMTFIDVTGNLAFGTFPTATVATGDVIVLHLNPDKVTAGFDAPASGDHRQLQQQASASYSSNYYNAWDFQATNTNAIAFSSKVFRIRDVNNVTKDGVSAFTSGATPAGAFPTTVQALQADGHWLPADCGGSACSTAALAQGISANWAGVSTTRATTLRRVSATDTNTKDDWAVGAGSIGSANPDASRAAAAPRVSWNGITGYPAGHRPAGSFAPGRGGGVTLHERLGPSRPSPRSCRSCGSSPATPARSRPCRSRSARALSDWLGSRRVAFRRASGLPRLFRAGSGRRHAWGTRTRAGRRSAAKAGEVHQQHHEHVKDEWRKEDQAAGPRPIRAGIQRVTRRSWIGAGFARHAPVHGSDGCWRDERRVGCRRFDNGPRSSWQRLRGSAGAPGLGARSCRSTVHDRGMSRRRWGRSSALVFAREHRQARFICGHPPARQARDGLVSVPACHGLPHRRQVLRQSVGRDRCFQPPARTGT